MKCVYVQRLECLCRAKAVQIIQLKNIVENAKFYLYKSAGFHYNSTCVSGL